MTYKEAKNQIAKDNGSKDWAHFKRNRGWFPEVYYEKAAKLFAAEKVKEALNTQSALLPYGLLQECLDTFTCSDESDRDLKQRIELVLKNRENV